MINRVIKRNGSYEEFNEHKIKRAIEKCGVEGHITHTVKTLVISNLLGTPSVECIQDLIEKCLMDMGLKEEAKRFIIYRERRRKERIPHCKKFDESFVSEYPIFEELADKQAIDFYWTHNSIELEQDMPDILTRMSSEQKNAVCYLQKIFTQYEGRLGEDYWSGRFKRMFPRHEFQRWAATASFVELQVHAPFYRRLNDLMSLEVEGFYDSYKQDPHLLDRMNLIHDKLDNSSDLVSIALFSLLEGVSLFGAFAFFKSFQSNGNNLLAKFVSGINFSARDENLHAQAGAEAFKILKSEMNLNNAEKQEVEDEIFQMVYTLYDQEKLLMESAYAGAEIINGVTLEDYNLFIISRINLVLDMLGCDTFFIGEKSRIDSWFYNSVESYQITDFFKTKTREYTHKWDMDGFRWNRK